MKWILLSEWARWAHLTQSGVVGPASQKVSFWPNNESLFDHTVLPTYCCVLLSQTKSYWSVNFLGFHLVHLYTSETEPIGSQVSCTTQTRNSLSFPPPFLYFSHEFPLTLQEYNIIMVQQWWHCNPKWCVLLIFFFFSAGAFNCRS